MTILANLKLFLHLTDSPHRRVTLVYEDGTVASITCHLQHVDRIIQRLRQETRIPVKNEVDIKIRKCILDEKKSVDLKVIRGVSS